ncbi:hypothetical protein MCOR07_003945 [Pyricularia oryzae]|uniref:Nudix hydrolase domain-containing protein n=2 Tax=Pyricularia TaxID=48558 RepID=A0ABQ8NVU3_PYRGI|nr:hypothetical protein MCOR33_001793 [Pyricularia grisea]KAI6623318.1 hypothetical protein MCOR07_003945 [Pyricularia oryzae]
MLLLCSYGSFRVLAIQNPSLRSVKPFIRVQHPDPSPGVRGLVCQAGIDTIMEGGNGMQWLSWLIYPRALPHVGPWLGLVGRRIDYDFPCEAMRPYPNLEMSSTQQESPPSSQRPLTKRSVVSCFIFKTDQTDGRARVALFRRSGKVRTYQHLLAPISGSVDKSDASPLAAAWRELQEETQLARADLELLRHGKSYKFTDLSIGREWTIYPFAFRLLRDDAAVRLDWEHDEWGWHDPLLIGDDFSDGVPRLAESLRRVWFEMDIGAAAARLLDAGLARLQTDHQSGARQLADFALRLLRDVMLQIRCEGMDCERWWASVCTVAWHVWKNGRESMGAAIMAVLVRALEEVDGRLRSESTEESVQAWQNLAAEVLEKAVKLREGHTSGAVVAEAFASYLGKHFGPRLQTRQPITVLTLSESSTIALALQHVVANTGFALDLRILESRPLFEGVSLAASLTDKMLISQAALGGAGTEKETKESEEAHVSGSAKIDNHGGGGGGGTETTTETPDSWRRWDGSPKLSITLYSDAAAALAAAQGVDLVVIGADRISASGAVSNKTGSLPAILSARHVAGQRGGHQEVRVVVVSESDKIAPPDDPSEHVVEDNGGEQLRRAWAADFNSERVKGAAEQLSRFAVDGAVNGIKVSVSNIFFEWVPPELIDSYISERGVLCVEEIVDTSMALWESIDRIFGGL